MFPSLPLQPKFLRRDTDFRYHRLHVVENNEPTSALYQDAELVFHDIGLTEVSWTSSISMCGRRSVDVGPVQRRYRTDSQPTMVQPQSPVTILHTGIRKRALFLTLFTHNTDNSTSGSSHRPTGKHFGEMTINLVHQRLRHVARILLRRGPRDIFSHKRHFKPDSLHATSIDVMLKLGRIPSYIV